LDTSARSEGPGVLAAPDGDEAAAEVEVVAGPEVVGPEAAVAPEVVPAPEVAAPAEGSDDEDGAAEGVENSSSAMAR
jgi:hypothetical protein